MYLVSLKPYFGSLSGKMNIVSLWLLIDTEFRF